MLKNVKQLLVRQGFLNALCYYSRGVIEAINMLWLFSLILSAKQIGLYKFITSSAYLIAYITQLGLPQGLTRFYTKVANSNNKYTFLSFIIISTTSIFFLFTGIAYLFKFKLYFLFGKNVDVGGHYFLLIFGIAFFLLMMMILKAYYGVLLMSVIPSFIQNVLIFSSIHISGWLYYYKIIDFDQLLYALLFIYIVCFAIMVCHLSFIGKLKIRFNFSILKPSFIKEFILYNLCTLGGNNGFSIATKIDALMISSMIGFKYNGIYAVTVMLPKLIEVPRKAIKQLSMPILSRVIHAKNWNEMGEIYKILSLSQLAASTFATVLLFTSIDQILGLIPNLEMKSLAKAIIFFLSMTKISDSIMGVGNDLMMMSKYYWFSTLSAILLVIFTIVFNLLLIPIWGIKGAALATFLAFLTYNFSICLFLKWKMKVHPFSSKMIIIIIIATATCFFSFFLPILVNKPLCILLRSCIVSILFFSMILASRVFPELNLYLLNLKKNYIKD